MYTHALRSTALLLVLTLAAGVALAAESGADTTAVKARRPVAERDWALGATMRGATIPFATDERRVASFVPMIFYEGPVIYFQGIEGGLTVKKGRPWEFAALGRLHFFDIPSEYQNQTQGDTMDWGLRARRNFPGPTHLDFEVMSDWQGHMHSNVLFGLDFQGRRWRLRPYVEAKFKTGHYNSYFYGLTEADVGADMNLSFGFTGKLHATSSLYLWAALKATRLGNNSYESPVVNERWLAESFLGVGLANDPTHPRKASLGNRPYIRLAHGWATPSSLADIFNGVAAKDPYNNQLTSVFYGHPLTDELFGLPLDIYLHGGLVWHWKSEVQKHSQEAVISVKLYYTVPWPVRWKLGAAEGMSYVNSIPYVEQTELEKKGYRTSKLLNYLDFSGDINLGDIVGSDPLREWWLGYGIHHRSAIFESAQQYGRIKGGSNFQTVYLQKDF